MRSWHPDALCRQVDPDLFFPEVGESAGPALRVCAACEVRAECAADALATREPYGVWGGMTERQRRRQLRDERQHRRQAGDEATAATTTAATTAGTTALTSDLTSGEDDAA